MSTESTVYVVDDDEATAASVAALLVSVGLRVKAYHSAEAFLTDFDPVTGGCIVLDIRMPGMNGLELQERLLADEIGLPIILISGHADQETREKARRNGAFAFLEKPFEGGEFCDVVRAALAQRGS